MNINRTILIIPALAPLARALAAGLSAGGVGMFETALYKDGVLAYYVSSGQIDEAFSNVLPVYDIQVTEAGTIVTPPTQEAKDAATNNLFTATKGAVPIEQCAALVGSSAVIDCDIESAQATFERLGLLIGGGGL